MTLLLVLIKYYILWPTAFQRQLMCMFKPKQDIFVIHRFEQKAFQIKVFVMLNLIISCGGKTLHWIRDEKLFQLPSKLAILPTNTRSSLLFNFILSVGKLISIPCLTICRFKNEWLINKSSKLLHVYNFKVFSCSHWTKIINPINFDDCGRFLSPIINFHVCFIGRAIGNIFHIYHFITIMGWQLEVKACLSDNSGCIHKNCYAKIHKYNFMELSEHSPEINLNKCRKTLDIISHRSF